jgi:hypothetical protein
LPPSQYQAPVTGREVRSWSERSTAARFLIGWLKYKITGMPTPNVWPYPS